MRKPVQPKTPHAMISRAVDGIRALTVVISRQSPGARRNLEVQMPAIPHAEEKSRRLDGFGSA